MRIPEYAHDLGPTHLRRSVKLHLQAASEYTQEGDLKQALACVRLAERELQYARILEARFKKFRKNQAKALKA